MEKGEGGKGWLWRDRESEMTKELDDEVRRVG